MSYIIAKTNNYFGLAPFSAGPNSNFQTNMYLVSSSEATQINIGDLVVWTSKATVRVPSSAAASAAAPFAATSSIGIVGVAAASLAANAGSTAAELLLNSSQMVLVYDDPNQLFTITESSSAVAGPQTSVGFNMFIVTTGVIGSTGPLQIGNASRSAMALGMGTNPVSGAGNVKVMGLHPVEGGHYTTQSSGTATTDVRKWIVKLISPMTVASTSIASGAVVNTSS